MTPRGKRAANPFRDLVKESSGLGTIREQLDRVEQLLVLRLNQIRTPSISGRSPRDTLIADLDLTTKDYEYIIALLAKQFQSVDQTRQGFTSVFQKYSMTILVSLVGVEATRDNVGFWDAYYNAMKPKRREFLETKVRESLEPLLAQKMLDTFPRNDLGKSRYVHLIALHACLNHQVIDLIVDDLKAFDARADKVSIALDVDDFAQRAKNWLQDRYSKGDSEVILQRLTTVLKDRAEGFFTRIAELYATVENNHGWPDIEFEDNHGLPEPAFAYLKAVLSNSFINKEETEEKGKIVSNSLRRLQLSQTPYLQFDLTESAFKVVIPGGTEVPEEGVNWTITVDQVSSTHNQSYDWSTGRSKAMEIVISAPPKLVRIESEFHEETFDVTDATERGLFLVGRSGRVFTNQRVFGGGTAFLLRAAHTKIQPSGPSRSEFSLKEYGPVAGWTGWSSFESSLSNITKLIITRVTSLGEKSWQITHRGGGEPDWKDGEFYKELRGPDGAVVYKTSPELLLPDDSEDWEIKCSTTDAHGNYWEIDGSWDTDLREQYFKIFEDSDDPWVGQFRISLIRGTSIVATRQYNIIQDLDVDISFEGNSKSQFTVPVHRASRDATKAFVTFKPLSGFIRCPEGSSLISNSVNQTHGTATKFLIESSLDKDLYRLPVTVVAPALTYLIPLREERLRWAGHYSTIDVNQIDSAGDIKVKFPANVHHPRLVFIKTSGSHQDGMAPEEITYFDVSKASGSPMWSIKASKLIESLTDGYNYRLALDWYPCSDREYAKSLESSAQRNQAFRDMKNGRLQRDDREYATLCDIALKPLLDDCWIEGSTLTLKTGRPLLWDPVCKVWPVSSPLSGAREISLSPNNGTFTGELPGDLVGSGALAVEVKDMSFLDIWSEQFPSSASRVADQPTSSLVDNPSVPHPWMYLGNEEMALTHPEIQELWNARFALTGPLSKSSNRSIGLLRAFNTKSQAFLGSHPRTALGQLDKSIIPPDLQIEAFIRSGIVFKSFASATTYGTIHPVPWVGLLQELNDVKTLERDVFHDADTEAEKEESLAYIRDVGNFLLSSWLKGSLDYVDHAIKLPASMAEVKNWKLEEIEKHRLAEAPSLLSREERLAGLAELASHRAEVIKMERLRKTVAILGNKIHLLQYLDTPEIRIAIRDLEFEGENAIRTQSDLWTLAPYISASCALLARMQAHGFIHSDSELIYVKDTWAQIARYAPRLAAYDLVCAEAITLGKNR